MKIRDSGMPEEAFWESLFDAPLILDKLGIGSRMRDAVELGCGYGTFTIPIARRISGMLRSFEIDIEMAKRTTERASNLGITNIRCELRDVAMEGFGVSNDSQDAALLFNILHCEEPVTVLAEAARVISKSGRVLVIHWRHDPKTPRGPDLAIRPKPGEILQWAQEAKLTSSTADPIDLPPWHYGLVLRKTA